MEKKFKLFCFGFGQVAKYFVKKLIKSKFNFEFVATNTQETKLKEFNSLNYKSYYFLNNKFDNSLLNDLNTSDKILVSIPPKNQTDVVLETFKKIFKIDKLNWITYLSATSVYGNKKGEWVDESTNTEPTSRRGIDRLNAEKEWIKYCKNFNLPVQIFRLSGIYSLENNIIKRLQLGKLKIVEKKNHFFSRIHVEDIAEVLTLSLKKFKSGEIYNISDDYPCSNEEIAKYTASLMGINIPRKIKPEDIESEMLKDFYKDSKKVSNKKMKNFFDFKLKYPTFKEGLSSIKNHIF